MAAETIRSNKAKEDFQNRQLAETTALRRDLGTQVNQARLDTLKEKQNAATVGDITSIGPTPDLGAGGAATRARGIAAGMDPSMFPETPGAQVKQYGGVGSLVNAPPPAQDTTTPQPSKFFLRAIDPTSPPTPQPGTSFLRSVDPTSPLNAPSTIGLRGTWAQTEKAAADKRAEGAANDKSYALYENLTNLAEKIRMQGDLNTANILRAHAQAALETAQAAKAGASADTVKVGEGGKRVLRSIDQAAPLIDQVMGDLRKQAPDIEDAQGNINPKYNTAGNLFGNLAKYAKYKIGFNDENSPTVQITKLLQPVQAGQYLAGSRSYQMLELALAHLDDPTLTTAEQYSRLKTLKRMMPEMRRGVIKSEVPVKIDAQGNPIGADYGTAPAMGVQPGASETPAQRLDRLMKLAGPQ